MSIDQTLLVEAERAVRYTRLPTLVPITGRELQGSGPERHYILDRYQSLFLRSLSGSRLFAYGEPEGPEGGLHQDLGRRYAA